MAKNGKIPPTGRASTAIWQQIAAREFERENFPASIAAGLLAVCMALRETTVEMQVWQPTPWVEPPESQEAAPHVDGENGQPL